VADGPSATDPHRYDAQVLSCILGDASGSRLYWELIDKGLADAASIDNEDMDAAGIVYGYVSAPPERVEQVSGVLKKVMMSPLEFSDDDLERAKTKIRTRLVLQGESSLRRLLSVGLEWGYSSSYLALDDELQRVAAVDRTSIGEMLERFPLRPDTEVRLLPE
jgi:predicted Zn-dependent peptidase